VTIALLLIRASFLRASIPVGLGDFCLRGKMRKLIATLMATTILVFGGVACDDNNAAGDKIDEDDTNFGPGDGKNEVGPGR